VFILMFLMSALLGTQFVDSAEVNPFVTDEFVRESCRHTVALPPFLVFSPENYTLQAVGVVSLSPNRMLGEQVLL
jgi:hypothetical protein